MVNKIKQNVLLIVVFVGTFSYEFQVSLPLFAEFTFHDTVNGYALLLAAMGIGAIFGGLFSASRRNATLRLLHVSLFLFGGSMIGAAFMPTLYLAILALVVVGIFSVSFISIANTILQVECTPSMRGRVMSLWTVAFLGSTPIGGPIIGWIGEHLGARYGLIVGGVVAIVVAVFGIIGIMKTKIAKSR